MKLVSEGLPLKEVAALILQSRKQVNTFYAIACNSYVNEAIDGWPSGFCGLNLRRQACEVERETIRLAEIR